MPQEVKITKIEVKEGDNPKGHWKNYILTGEGMKNKMSVFMPNSKGLDPSTLVVGDVISAELKLEGNYVNIDAYAILEKAKPPETHSGESEGDKKLTPKETFQTEAMRNNRIEQDMFWKELGESLRCGLVDRTTPRGKVLAGLYFSKMYEVLGIEFKEETK